MPESPSSSSGSPEPKGSRSKKARDLSPFEALLHLRPKIQAPTRSVHPEFGLASKEISRIPTEGIRLGAEIFWCPDLQPWVTNPKKGAVRKQFLILYDPAALANRRLTEIHLHEVDHVGRRRLLLVVPNRRRVRDGYSNGRLLREIDRHERITEATVSKSRDYYRDLTLGQAAKEKLLEDQARRAEHRSSSSRSGSSSSGPRRPSGTPAPPDDSAVRDMLAGRDRADQQGLQADPLDSDGTDGEDHDTAPASPLSGFLPSDPEWIEHDEEDED